MAAERAKRAGINAKMNGNGGSLWRSASKGAPLRNYRAMKERPKSPANVDPAAPAPPEKLAAKEPPVKHEMCCGPDEDMRPDEENQPPEAGGRGLGPAPGGGGEAAAAAEEEWETESNASEMWNPMASLVGPKKETMDIQTEQPAAPAERPQSGQSSYFTKLYMSKASMHTTPRSRVELKYNETVRKGQLNPFIKQ